MPTRRNSRSRCTAHGRTRFGALALVALLLPGLAACLPPQASFDAGLGTSRVTGSLSEEDANPTLGGPLVVALKYHHQFIQQPDGRALLRPTAHVLRPGADGTFSVSVPADVVTMELMFIAPDHLTEVFHFRRQLGVGDIRYRARLRYMPDWRSHYYTFLGPQLEYLITEPRYRLAAAEQRLLGDWLQQQNERLGARPRPAPPPQPPAEATPPAPDAKNPPGAEAPASGVSGVAQ